MRTSTKGGVFVWREVIYLRSRWRRPVRFAPYRPGEDLQGALPAGWCEKCGREIYGVGKSLCEMCERWAWDEKEYGICPSGALQGLHPGEKSCSL